MTYLPKNRTSNPIWLNGIAVFALIFGFVTLFASGSVLFGPDTARASAGAFVPFVVWFNLVAGLFYIMAAIGIWLGKPWAFALAILIAAGTALTALLFARYASAGGGFEMRTVGALAFRTGFWAIVALILRKKLHSGAETTQENIRP